MDFFISHYGLALLFYLLLLDVLAQVGGGISYILFWRQLREVYGVRAATVTRERHSPLVSVVIAAYNEEDVIEKTISALLKTDYQQLELIVVDDGSTDNTSSTLSSIANNFRNVKILTNKVNMGKCRSIEAGIEFSAGQIICLVDADTVVAHDFVSEIVHSILSGEADATCGNIKVGNKVNMLTHFQSIEYVSILNRIRAIQDINGFITTMPGAACAFKKSVLASVGGYSSGSLLGSLAEDADFTIRLSLKNRRIRFAPRAIAYTEVPASWKNLFFQRRRWFFGNIQCILGYISEWKQCIKKPFYGFPFFFYENIGRPVFEFTRNITVILFMNFYGLHNMLLVLAVSFCISVARAIAFYIVAKEPVSDIVYLPARFVVWPLFNVIPFSLAALHFLSGQGVAWNKLARSGDVAER
jgi:peptidoglycan-N-acetylglucosamine deacetylase